MLLNEINTHHNVVLGRNGDVEFEGASPVVALLRSDCQVHLVSFRGRGECQSALVLIPQSLLQFVQLWKYSSLTRKIAPIFMSMTEIHFGWSDTSIRWKTINEFHNKLLTIYF